MTVMALTTGTNTSFLDRLYKKTGNNVQLHGVACSGLQLAKQLDSQKDIVIVVMEIVDSVSGVLPSHVSQERWQAN